MDNYGHSTQEHTDGLVDEQIAYRLAEEHNLPPIEVDAALYGLPVSRAKSILKWVDEEEYRLTRAHGLIEGRKLYRPLKMLRHWSKKHGAGRHASTHATSNNLHEQEH